MEKLPPELLSKILLYLPLEDRLSCSLTCRRWAEVMSSSQLLDDVWLDIAGHEMVSATSVLANTQRQYPKLLLFEADLSEFDSVFWEKIGANLRVLELDGCSWSTHVFYAILQQCTKLESLKLVTYGRPRKIPIDDFVLPEGACHEELRDSLNHMRHLHLDIQLTAEILDLLLGLMPNVTSIFLSSKFADDSDFLKRLPSILERNRIIRFGAHLWVTQKGSKQSIEFIELTSGSLEELRIVIDDDRTIIGKRACEAVVNCTKLRHLTLDGFSSSFDTSRLEKLVSNSPNLETLNFRKTPNFEDKDMVHLVGLKNLRSLTLREFHRPRMTKECLCRLGEISTLVKLDLDFVNVGSRVIRALGCLTNLRSLALGGYLDSDCFEAIYESFERLTELNLGSVAQLTNFDGKKLCRFKELRSLKFLGGFTDSTFESGVGSRAMKSLSIYHSSLTDAGLASIASHHDRLEELTLFGCYNITDAGIMALLQNEPRLKYLRLVGYVRRDFKESIAWKDVCPRLRRSYVDSETPMDSLNYRRYFRLAQ